VHFTWDTSAVFMVLLTDWHHQHRTECLEKCGCNFRCPLLTLCMPHTPKVAELAALLQEGLQKQWPIFATSLLLYGLECCTIETQFVSTHEFAIV
jgi:hypothetical protein